jgi:hypothetical protein
MPVISKMLMRRARQCAVVLVTMSAVMTPSQVLGQKPTDTSVQSSPTTPPPKAAVVDGAVEASPAPEPKRTVVGSIAPGTALPITLSEAVDSGKLKNGSTLEATLTSAVPVKLSGTQCEGTCSGITVPAGAKVTVSVVGAVPADKISSAGEMSLQVMKVGEFSVYCDTQTFKGKEGHKDVADSAPDKGTDAMLAAGAALTFHVLPAPTMTPGK